MALVLTPSKSYILSDFQVNQTTFQSKKCFNKSYQVLTTNLLSYDPYTISKSVL
jgi:hypothetical protein